MKLIQPSVELYPQENYTLEDIYKQIEKCARVSYKSEDKITDTSSKTFVDNLIKAGHYAPLEFGTIYLNVFPEDDFGEEVIRFFFDNPYSRYQRIMQGNIGYVITTNLRVIVENHLEEAMKYLCKPTEYHHKRYCVKFITDIGTAREFTRHRVFSFMQESTRYCNYSKNKFGNEIICIEPYWIEDAREFQNSEAYSNAYERLYSACEEAEGAYFDLLEEGFKPQEARQLLPLATKTELVMCGFEDDWKHFFDLRLRGTTGAPHPDAKQLAQIAWDLFKDNYKIEL